MIGVGIAEVQILKHVVLLKEYHMSKYLWITIKK
jgi:hypothetical protein